MRRTVAVLSAIIGLAFAAGCTPSTQRVDGEAGPAGARTSQPAPAGTTASGGASSPAGTATPSGAASPAGGAAGGTAPRQVTQTIFRTPSKNIACTVRKDGVRCDINDRSWTPPPKPASCELDWAAGLILGKTRKIDFTCKGDASLTIITDAETLEYGQAVQAGDYLCRSERSGVRCENTDTGHGFTLSAAKYTTF